MIKNNYTIDYVQRLYIRDHIATGRVNEYLNFNIWIWECGITKSVVPSSVRLNGQVRLNTSGERRHVYGMEPVQTTFKDRRVGIITGGYITHIPNSTTSSVIPHKDIDIKRNLKDVFLRKRLVLYNDRARYNLVIHQIRHDHLGYDGPMGHTYTVLRVTDNMTNQTLINYLDVENSDNTANHFFETWFRLQDSFPDEFRGQYQSILRRYGNRVENIPYSHINGWGLQSDTENPIACGAIYTMFLYRILNDPKLALIPFETLKCDNLNPRIGMPMKYIQNTYDLLSRYVGAQIEDREPDLITKSLAISEPQHIKEMTVEDLQKYHNNTLRFDEGDPRDEGRPAPTMFGTQKRIRDDLSIRRTVVDNTKRFREFQSNYKKER